MANEPCAYREGIAAAIGQLRSEVEVRTVEPAALEGSLSRFSPDMVVCSKATDALKGRVGVWVELYPEHAAHSVAHRRRTTEYAEISSPTCSRSWIGPRSWPRQTSPTGLGKYHPLSR
jgi:hypothetical protein